MAFVYKAEGLSRWGGDWIETLIEVARDLLVQGNGQPEQGGTA